MSARVVFLVLTIALVGQSSYLQSQNSTTGSDTNYDMRLEKGVELYSRSKYVEAEVFFNNLKKSDPDRKEAYLWLGYVLSKESKWPQAREAFKRYTELAPNDAEGLIETAKTYMAEDNKVLAKLWYKKAQDCDPTNQSVRQALQQLDDNSTANVPKPSQPEQDGAKVPANVGFWDIGLAGVTGARTVWWGRAIILFIMVTGIVGGAGNVTRVRERYPLVPTFGFFIVAGFWAVFTYVILWGIPTGWNWGWLVAFAMLNMMGTAGAVNAAPQPTRF